MSRAVAPASSANLGPGFDALAVALRLYVEVSVVASDRLTIEATGAGASLSRDEGHLAARVARMVAGHDRFAMRVHSEIPVARGLGSSAALALAAAAALGADDPLEVAVALDGHPENAAASFRGGLVAAARDGARTLSVRLALDGSLAFVVVVPEVGIATATARAVLPATVPLEDASANLGRIGLLIGGLADHAQLVAAAGEDRIHQPYRAAIFPAAAGIISALTKGGALTASWSGAGPSMIGVCTVESAAAVAEAGAAALAAAGLAGSTMVLEPDRTGLVVEGDPPQGVR